MLKKPLPIHSEVVTLDRMISPPPDWFKEIKLCFQWIDINHKSQKCSEGQIRQNCTTFLRSVRYRYSEGIPIFHCQVQFSFFSIGYEDWFQNFGLCFRWNNDKKSDFGKCKKGGNQTFCGQINSFVSILYSNKDDIGCRLEWMLSIPKHAPLWLQNTKIYMQYMCQSEKKIRGRTHYWHKIVYADASQYRDITPSFYSSGSRYDCFIIEIAIGYPGYH